MSRGRKAGQEVMDGHSLGLSRVNIIQIWRREIQFAT